MRKSAPVLCECGCGKPAPIAARNHTKYGWVKGTPMRFVRGHAMRGRTLNTEARAKVSAAHKGKTTPESTRRKMSEAQLGEKGNNWRGGIANRAGRRLVYVGRDHPMADTYGYVYEHRLVASRAAGRVLARAEHVHHIDLDPLNNSPGNLAILTPGQHRIVHNKINAGANPLDAIREVTT